MAFGDIRVAGRAEWLVGRIAATGSLVLKKLGEDRPGEMAAHRFLSSPYVSPQEIVAMEAARTAAQASGLKLVAVEDTTEINFAGREGKRRGFGPAGDGKTPGFFIHPTIAVDVATEAVIGLVDAQIWTRAETEAGGQARPAAKKRRFEDKESARWLTGCAAAAATLAAAAAVTVVADREGDIYELFARTPAGIELIVRAAQDRRLAGGGRLSQALAAAPALVLTKVRVAPRGPGDKGRTATVALRARRVSLARPAHLSRLDLPPAVELTLVEAEEIAPPPGQPPLLWRLITTHPAAAAEEAEEVVRLYRLRWRIEEVFRVLKSDGLALDDSQVIEAERMFNLAAAALAGAVRTIQLVGARDGSSRPASDVVDPCFAAALTRLSRKLEGATERQKNPHPPDKLSFVAWIAARLGGWNCYYRKPGPKTMRRGWTELEHILAGYALATQGENP